MSPHWSFIRHPPLCPAENMAWDEALLESAATRPHPLLRFYGWSEPAATFGYFQRILDVEPMTPLRPLLRRPTGGGLVPHDADWTYSVTLPPADPWYSCRAIESYRRIHHWIRLAFARLEIPTELSPVRRPEAPGRCFIGAEQFDLLFNGTKIAGAAQRRTRHGLLIQGSIQPPSGIERPRFESAMFDVAGRLDGEVPHDEGVTWAEFKPDAMLAGRVAELATTKYSRDEFNRRR